MKPAQKEYKTQLIQKIQINKHNVFEDDEARREFMVSRFGVSSTKELSIDQLKLLLDFCYKKVSDIPIDRLTSAQANKIMNLWTAKALYKDHSSLNSFVSRICKREIVLDEITKREATKVIVALERM